MNKNIIFDYDGTLVEFPIKFMLDETFRIVEQSGHPKVSFDSLMDAFSDFDFFRFARIGENPIEAEKLFKENYWKEYNWDNFPLGEPFPETAETLKCLTERGYILSIATARVIEPEKLLNEMNSNGLGSFFKLENIKTRSSHLQDWKDKQTQINETLKSTNTTANNSIIIGDIPSDIISGKECGLKHNIAVQSGGIKKDVLEGSEPDAVILNLGDLPNLLEDLEF